MIDPSAPPASDVGEHERQLHDMNEALLVASVRQHELTEQAEKAEAKLREGEAQLAADLAVAQQLQAVSTQMIREGDVEALYNEVLDAAVAIMRSDMASMQIVDKDQDALRMVAWRGFDPAFGNIFELNRSDTRTSCSIARRLRQRIVVPDVETWDLIAGTPALEDHRKTGIRAVQSTPLVSRSGLLVGMISTHWRQPHQPSERDLRHFDVLARQAADLMERKRAEAEREQLLLEMDARQTLFDSILSSVHEFVYVFDREGRFTYANRMLLELWGRSSEQTLGKTMAELNYPADVEEQLLSDVGNVIETGQVVTSVTHYTNPGGVSGYYENVLAPVPSADGRVELIVGSSRDITHRRQAEDTQQLLLGELNHRVKNTLATIQAIAQQTLRRTRDPEQFVASFSGRIQALARVHTLLTRTTWQGADLRELIRDQVLLGPIDETRLTAWGPSVMLEPQMAMHMAMVLHELGTNSCKYGALSVTDGWVSVSWTVEGAELHLRWLERGGPRVEGSRHGFGTTMIEQSLNAHDGTAVMVREAEGVSWIIMLPLQTAAIKATEQPVSVPPAASISDRPARAPAPGTRAHMAGKRALVVEDEPLVALDVIATLDDAGIEAVGAGTAEQALQLIQTMSFDAALVDVNLNGRPVDDIAAALTQLNVPFAFVTGYDRNSLPQAFRGATMLAKPCTPETLLDVTEKLIAGRQRHGQTIPFLAQSVDFR